MESCVRISIVYIKSCQKSVGLHANEIRGLRLPMPLLFLKLSCLETISYNCWYRATQGTRIQLKHKITNKFQMESCVRISIV